MSFYTDEQLSMIISTSSILAKLVAKQYVNNISKEQHKEMRRLIDWLAPVVGDWWLLTPMGLLRRLEISGLA